MNAVTQTKNHITKGSIFDDLGFSNEQAENLKVRAKLMQELTQIIKETGETQSDIAKRLGVTQSRISDLMCGKIQKFTIDNLVNMMSKSGYSVEINTKVA